MSSAVKAVLSDYCQALSNVCSIGIQLAGMLENELRGIHHAEQMSNAGEANHVDLLRKMSQINILYNEIKSKTGPLWLQIQPQSAQDDERHQLPHSPSLQHHNSSLKITEMCKCLVEFHQSAVEAGTSLLDTALPATRQAKYPLTRKNSPCIVITDTEKSACGGDYSFSQLSRMPPNQQLRSTSKYSAKTHLPSDDDMNNIINFLSSTREVLAPASTQRPAQSNFYSSAGSPNSLRKFALSNQRSSPLPGSSDGTTQFSDNSVPYKSADFIRHHSDWQLYARPTAQNESPNNSNNWGMSNSSPVPTPYSPYQSSRVPSMTTSSPPGIQPPAQIPFSSWLSGSSKDNIWAHESNASSGDESMSTNTDQLFSTNKLDLSSAIVERSHSGVYRRPGDNTSSLNFDSSLASSVTRQQLLPTSAALSLSSTSYRSSNDAWSMPTAISQCWPTNSGSDDGMMGHNELTKQHTASASASNIGNQSSIWKPLDLSAVKVNPPPVSIHSGAPFTVNSESHHENLNRVNP